MSLTMYLYNPESPQPFDSVRSELEAQLKTISNLSIEHTGSTSVLHFSTSSLVNIAILVNRENLLSAHSALVDKSQFEYAGGLGSAECHVYRDNHDPPRCTIQLCVTGTVLARSLLRLRDLLHSTPDLLQQYRQLKLSAVENNLSITDYSTQKHNFMQRTLALSGVFNSAELDAISNAYTPWTISKIQTERLILRDYVREDEDGVFELESNEENVRYQDYPPKTREQASEDVASTMLCACEVPRRIVELAVEYEGRFIGRVGAKIARSLKESVQSGNVQGSLETEVHANLWYSFLPSSQGKGLATEAMKALIEELKRKLDEKIELEIECDPRNTGSWKMAERLNFTKHSLTERAWESKGEWVDSLVYRATI